MFQLFKFWLFYNFTNDGIFFPRSYLVLLMVRLLLWIAMAECWHMFFFMSPMASLVCPGITQVSWWKTVARVTQIRMIIPHHKVIFSFSSVFVCFCPAFHCDGKTMYCVLQHLYISFHILAGVFSKFIWRNFVLQELFNFKFTRDAKLPLHSVWLIYLLVVYYNAFLTI